MMNPKPYYDFLKYALKYMGFWCSISDSRPEALPGHRLYSLEDFSRLSAPAPGVPAT